MNAYLTALYTKLATLSGGNAVYDGVAPQSATPPWVVYFYQDPRSETSDPQRKEDDLVTVRVTSKVSLKEARTLLETIDAGLDNVPLTVTGKRVLWQRKESGIEYSEDDEHGGWWFHAGGVYRVRIAHS